MKNRSFVIPVFVFWGLLCISIFSQEADFSQNFFNDIRGYHAVGQSQGESKDEALRLAKSGAIKRIFTEIGKDEFFQEMFIAVFPQFIVLEASRAESTETGFSALVQVVIDQNAIIMLEEQYADAVFELLNQGDNVIAKSEALLLDAKNSELNLRMSEAMLLFKSAEVHCQEIDNLFKNINNATVRSDKGNSLPVIKKLNNSLRTRAKEGVLRLEKLEQKMEQNSALEELVKTLELILSEIDNIEIVIDSYIDLQPFYDLPKSQLENIRIELVNAIEKSKTIDTKLKTLSEQIPVDRLLMQEKVHISQNDLIRLMNKLRNMKKDVDQEIRYPRLVRQQHAQNWKKFAARTGDIFKYIFLHKPADVLSFRFSPGIRMSMDEGFLFTDNYQFYIRAEKAFNVGFWIKTQYNYQSLELLSRLHMHSATQQLAMGYFRDKILFGAALSWDWLRAINTLDSTKEKTLRIYFGGIDRQRIRAAWLAAFSYQFPHFISPFLPAYQLNGGVELLLRLEDLLLVETSVRSGTIQNSLPVSGELGLENYQYQFDWRLGLGLRFPGPVVWGVCYNYNASYQVNSPAAAENMGPKQENKYWSAYWEYSF